MDNKKLMDCIKKIGTDNFVKHIDDALDALIDVQYNLEEFVDEVDENVDFNRMHYNSYDVSIVIGSLRNFRDAIDRYNLIGSTRKAYDSLSSDLKCIQEAK